MIPREANRQSYQENIQLMMQTVIFANPSVYYIQRVCWRSLKEKRMPKALDFDAQIPCYTTIFFEDRQLVGIISTKC